MPYSRDTQILQIIHLAGQAVKVTDAIPVEVGGKIKTISVAEEFAQAISAVYHEEPVSTLVGGDFAL